MGSNSNFRRPVAIGWCDQKARLGQTRLKRCDDVWERFDLEKTYIRYTDC